MQSRSYIREAGLDVTACSAEINSASATQLRERLTHHQHTSASSSSDTHICTRNHPRKSSEARKSAALTGFLAVKVRPNMGSLSAAPVCLYCPHWLPWAQSLPRRRGNPPGKACLPTLVSPLTHWQRASGVTAGPSTSNGTSSTSQQAPGAGQGCVLPCAGQNSSEKSELQKPTGF